MLTARPEAAPWQRCTNGATGGEGRNRTGSSPTASLNTLIYKGILTLILQGFKHFLTLSGLTRRLPAAYPSRTRLLKKSLKVSLKVFCDGARESTDRQ